MAKARITLGNMSGEQIIHVMCENNRDAVQVCRQLLQHGENIDPGAPFGSWLYIHVMDAVGIYEERIHMLYKDVCGEYLGKMIAVLRALQLGQLAGVTFDSLNHAVDNHGEGLDLGSIIKVVEDRLPNFDLHADYLPVAR